MKKSWLFAIFIIGLLLTGFACIEAKKEKNSDSVITDSDSNDNSNNKKSSNDVSDKKSDLSSQDANDLNSDNEDFSKKTKEKQSITLVGEDGNEYNVEVRVETKNKGNESQIKIKVRNVEINSDVELEQEANSLKAKLSNGIKSEIKVMPDTASQTAIEKLQTKYLNVELKEVGEGNNLSVVYEAEGNKSVKFLGLFKVRAEIKAVISAENGEVLRLEKPWWYFLAFKEGVVDCDENNLDLCDDETECLETGLIWFNNSCINSCPEDTLICDDNETIIPRSEELNCEFDFDVCPIISINETNTTEM